MDRRGLLAVVLAALLMVTACSGSDAAPPPAKQPSSSPSPSPSTSPSFERYVALGDSYSAGPLIPTTDLAAGCARSDHNYPSLLARELRVRTFVDVTCSGARTADLAASQPGFGDATIPPQLRALDRRTDLVTIGIGGND